MWQPPSRMPGPRGPFAWSPVQLAGNGLGGESGETAPTGHENSQQQAQQQFTRPGIYQQTHLRQNPSYPPPGVGLQQTGLAHDMNKPPFPQQQGLAGQQAPGQQAGATTMVYPGPHVASRPQLNPNAPSANIQQAHGNQQYYARGNGGAGAQNQGGNQGPPRHVQQSQRTAGMNMPIAMIQAPQAGQQNAQQSYYGGPAGHQMYIQPHMPQQTHLIYAHPNQPQHATMPGAVEFQPPNEALSMIPPHSSSARYTIENGEMNSPAMNYRYSSPQYQTQQPTAMYVPQQSTTYMNPYNMYHQSQMLNMHPPGNRPGAAPAVVNAPPQPAPAPKRVKNIIRIVDPNTQIDVTEDVLSNAGNNPTPPNSGASSALDTSPACTPPPGGDHASDIAAQFARQVAAAASSSGSGPASSTGTGPASAAGSGSTQPSAQLFAASQSQSSDLTATTPSSTMVVTNSTTTSNRTKGEKDISVNISRSSVADRIVTNSNSITNDTQESSVNVIAATKDSKIVNKTETEVPLPPVIVKSVEKVEHKLPIVAPSAHFASAPTQIVRSATDVREQGPPGGVVYPPPAAPAKKSECAPPPPFPTSKISNPSEVSAHVAPFGVLSSSIISATDKMAGTPFSSSQVIISAPIDHLPSRDAVNEPGSHHVVPPAKNSALVPAPFTQQQGQASTLAKPPSSQVMDSGRLSGNHSPVTPSPFGQAQPQQQSQLHSQVNKQQNGDVQSESKSISTDSVEGFSKDNKQHSQLSTGPKAAVKKNKGKAEPEKKDEERNDAPVIAVVEEPIAVQPPVVPSESEESTVSSPDDEESKVTEEMLDKEERRKVAEKNEENSKVCTLAIETSETVSEVIDDVPSTQFKLRYEYKSDQWSPINLEGKKQYDRDFLLRIQTEPPSLKKPDGLPNLEVIRDDVVNTMNLDRIPTILNKPRGGPVNDFFPGFGGLNNNKTQMRGSRGSQQGRKEPPQQPPKKVVSISLCQEVNLRNVENPWVPSYKQKTNTEVENAAEKLYRKVRSLLNKLTPQNFSILMDQVRNSQIDSEAKMFGVIELVFEKAIDEPNFSVAYANMCKALSTMRVTSATGDTVDFRKLIIGRCQTEFEKDANEESRQREEKQKIIDAESDPEKKKILQGELKEAISIVRRRSLGNIRFIGELFKLKMLTSKIMHECVRKLLNESDEESYECLCRLLSTIGKDLEFPTPNKPPTGSNKPQQPFRDTKVDEYFVQMNKIVNSRQTSSRVRFMLLDVVDLRAKNWVPRRDENNPKTIDQIHREAEAEEQEKQLMYHTPMGKRDDRMDRRGGSNMGGKRGNNENEGWNTVGSGRKASITPMPDTSKCKMRMENLDENNIQLGPQTTNWSKGSMGGGSRPHESERPPQGPGMNRYAPLSGGEHSQMDGRRSQSRQQPSHPMSGRDGRNMGGSVSQQLPISNHRGGGGGGGYKGSYSREHEQAIANVKNIANNEGLGRSSNNNMHQKLPPSGSRSNSVTRDVGKDTRSVESEIDLEKLEKKVKDVIDEYLNNVEMSDAILNVSELVPESKMSHFVTILFNNYLEKSAKARTNIGELLSELVIKKKLSLDQFWKGMKEIFEFTEDMAIDIPKFWEYLAEIFAPLFQAEVLFLDQLRTIILPILKEEQTSKLLAPLLKGISAVSTVAAVKLWRSSKLQYSDFMSADKVDQYIERHKLNFLQDGASVVNTFMSKDYLVSNLKKELNAHMYIESNSQLVKRSDMIFTWIKEHVPEQQQNDPSFIRALVTSIAEISVNSTGPDCYEANLPIFAACCTVIKRYVDNKDVLELETLFALQSFVHHLEHPKGLLHSFFNTLYEEEVVSDEGFLSWKAAEGQAVEGHAVAVKAVNSFLCSFKHSEDDEEST